MVRKKICSEKKFGQKTKFEEKKFCQKKIWSEKIIWLKLINVFDKDILRTKKLLDLNSYLNKLDTEDQVLRKFIIACHSSQLPEEKEGLLVRYIPFCGKLGGFFLVYVIR